MKPARLLFPLMLVLVACSHAASSSPPNADEPAKTETKSAPIIAALKTHDGKVSIIGGGKELRVMVTKDDGTVVADNATLDELKTKDPETWMLVKSAVARGGRGTYLDATLDSHSHSHPSPAAAPGAPASK